MVLYVTHGASSSGSSTLQLSKNPNPRMSDGDPPWLSIDLRVFKTNPGLSPTAGIEHPAAGAASAYPYIRDVLDAYNGWGAGTHPFDELPTGQDDNRLELATEDVNGNPAFNYAIARVRFRAPDGIDAVDVRVFFRMWTTGWNALEYDTDGSYRRMGRVPLLGIAGRGGQQRAVLRAGARGRHGGPGPTSTTARTLEGNDAAEVYAYFGCWLDVNQDVARFPVEPDPDDNGPFNAADYPDGLNSIQELMRGLHQCLVAEIDYDLDPTVNGATPGSSDNLAQRNILFDDSDNPGSFAAHLVHHTFELKPSPVSFEQWELAAQTGSGAAAGRLHPDELVIDWGELPRDSLVTFYMPQVDARAIVRANARRQSPGNLTAVGIDTIRCKVTDVGFLPIPGPMPRTIAGLLSVQLPPGVPGGRGVHGDAQAGRRTLPPGAWDDRVPHPRRASGAATAGQATRPVGAATHRAGDSGRQSVGAHLRAIPWGAGGPGPGRSAANPTMRPPRRPGTRVGTG